MPGRSAFYGRTTAELLGQRGYQLRTLSGELELEALKEMAIETGMTQSEQIRHVTPHGEIWILNIVFPIHDTDRAVEAIGVIGPRHHRAEEDRGRDDPAARARRGGEPGQIPHAGQCQP